MSRLAETSRKVVVAMAGASGSLYALRLVSVLTRSGFEVYFAMTRGAEKVLAAECGVRLSADSPKAEGFEAAGYPVDRERLRTFAIGNVAAPFSSGTFVHRGMALVPCSMGTLGRIAHGFSSNLVERAADVCLKERRRLILVPRETPLNLVHLENLRTLALAGATILPAMPGFYTKPKTIEDLVDSVVGKVLDQLGVEHDVSRRWGSPRSTAREDNPESQR